MPHSLEPVLHPVAIRELRPTQMTVGMQEVSRKRANWRERRARDGDEFLGRHMIPVVIGPAESHWLIDQHHLTRALYEEGVEEVLVWVVARLGHLSKKRFYTFMDNRNWLHPYDADGRRQDWSELPRHIGKLVDDPYRSLAGAVRRAGGCAKDQTPYAEFLWADFFRDHLRRHYVEASFPRAVTKALVLARGHEASYLPGFAGPQNDGVG